MSYILEALKKSEQDRGHGSIPGVQTIHSSSISYQQDSRPLWPWLIAIIVLINIAALLYLFVLRPPQEFGNTPPLVPASTQQAHLTTERVSTQQVEPEIIIASPVTETMPQKIEQTKNIEPAPTRAAEKSAEPEPAPVINKIKSTQPARNTTINYNEVLDIHQLPPEIMQQIPEMKFSAHVYSSNPQQRSLVINGKFMEEGELLNDNLRLSEITSGGAIFTFKGYYFSTSVLSGWN